jgi:hypothetical protein
MKILYPIIFLILTISAQVSSAEGTPFRIRFQNENFIFAWEKKDGMVHEFFRSSETANNWTKLIAIHFFPSQSDPKSAVVNLATVLKRQNPNARFQIIENPATGNVIIDFITWPPDSSCVEFNVFKYKPNPNGKGLVAFQFAMRDTEYPRILFRKLKNIRPQIIKEMASADFLKKVKK